MRNGNNKRRVSYCVCGVCESQCDQMRSSWIMRVLSHQNFKTVKKVEGSQRQMWQKKTVRSTHVGGWHKKWMEEIRGSARLRSCCVFYEFCRPQFPFCLFLLLAALNSLCLTFLVSKSQKNPNEWYLAAHRFRTRCNLFRFWERMYVLTDLKMAQARIGFR